MNKKQKMIYYESLKIVMITIRIIFTKTEKNNKKNNIPQSKESSFL